MKVPPPVGVQMLQADVVSFGLWLWKYVTVDDLPMPIPKGAANHGFLGTDGGGNNSNQGLATRSDINQRINGRQFYETYPKGKMSGQRRGTRLILT